MNDLIQINNDGLTGRLCNPYPKYNANKTKSSAYIGFEATVKSYPVTDTPLVPGSVHKIIGLVWQKRFKYEWCDEPSDYVWQTVPKSSDGDNLTFDQRQAYQLIDEPTTCPTCNDVNPEVCSNSYHLNQEKPQFKTAEEWISVKDRMLEKFGYYLSCFKKDDYIRYEVVQLYKRQDGSYCFTDNEDVSSVTATHWMPLPIPPTE